MWLHDEGRETAGHQSTLVGTIVASGFHRIIIGWNDSRAANRRCAVSLRPTASRALACRTHSWCLKFYGLMSGVKVIPLHGQHFAKPHSSLNGQNDKRCHEPTLISKRSISKSYSPAFRRLSRGRQGLGMDIPATGFDTIGIPHSADATFSACRMICKS